MSETASYGKEKEVKCDPEILEVYIGLVPSIGNKRPGFYVNIVDIDIGNFHVLSNMRFQNRMLDGSSR